MPKTMLINPTLEANIPLVIALMESIHGLNSGHLSAYTVYSLADKQGLTTDYVLTLDVLQFKGNAQGKPTLRRLDIVEPTAEAKGSFGAVYPVVQSIAVTDKPAFEQHQVFVVKAIMANQTTKSDKKNKPNYSVRAARREHYLASQNPQLGVDYELIEEELCSYLHMNRAPGLPLQHYLNKLDARKYLSLACALLETVPQQIHQIVQSGKRQGQTIVHCDIKDNNIMAKYHNGQWLITVIDFGLAKTMNDSQYSTLFRRGNVIAWDSQMLQSHARQRPIHYNQETDAYALFTLILKLGGLQRPDNSFHQLQQEVSQGCLPGLFEHLDFPAQIKEQLIKLSKTMIHADRKMRITVPQALQQFQNILLHIPNADTPPSSLPQPTSTAAALAQHIQEDIDTDIPLPLALKSWVASYRSLSRDISASEYALFQKMSLTISDRVTEFIYHSGMMNEYNDESTVRLALRHHQLIELILTDRVLPYAWIKRFDALCQQLPLQVSVEDELFCQVIGDYKAHISNLLIRRSESFKEDMPFILVHLLEEQKVHLRMDFARWSEQLFTLANTFNRIAAVFFKLEELVPLYQSLAPLNPLWEHQFELWARTITTRAIEEPDDLQNELEQREELGHLLHYYNNDANQQVLNSMSECIPTLKKSDYCLEKVNEVISKLNFADQEQVVALYKQLSLCIALKKLYLFICNNDGCLTENEFLRSHCKNKFYALLNDLNIPDLHEQCDKLGTYFFNLDALGDFITQLDCLYQITDAINILMIDPASTAKLLDIIAVHSALNNLYPLNLSLNYLQPATTSHEALLAEFSRFYANPNRYTPLQKQQISQYEGHFLASTTQQTLQVVEHKLLGTLNHN